MMKHYLTLLLLLAASLPSFAQGAFSNMSLGLEVGTAGPGVSVFFPLVTERLFIGVSYHAPKMTFTHDFEARIELNSYIRDVNARLDQAQITDKRIEELPSDKVTITGKAKIDFTGFQARAYFYPEQTGKFFLAAGLRIGQKDLLQIEGTPDRHTWSVYQSALAVNALLPADKQVSGLSDAMRYSFDKHTFELSPNAPEGKASATISTNNVCPYFGIGWGRAIPQRHRVGFQFEMGVWYHGQPELTSPNEVRYDSSTGSTDDILRYLEDCPVYPQITFRLTGRIF